MSARVDAGGKALAASPRRPPRDAFELIAGVIAVAAPAVLVAIIVLLARQAWPAITYFGASFLSVQAWNPVREHLGALTFIWGTVATSILALVMAVPVGVGTALFLAEPGLARIRGGIGVGVELLAAIPSVVYGLWGLYVLAPWFYHRVEVPLNERLPNFVLFAEPRQTSLLTASLVVAIMVLPTLASISRDVIRAVPVGLRESSLALGATWWETIWQVVLPAARAGIFGATVLALGRALGETIAVTMVIGNRPQISASLFAPAYTLASVIANEFTEATGRIYPAALMELGLILVLLSLVINVVALTLVHVTTGRSSR